MAFFGVCYSPYRRRNGRSGVTETEVDADMAIISTRFTHTRTYSAEDGDQWNVDNAAKRGLKIALGIWVDDNRSGDVNRRNIDHALQQAQAAAAAGQPEDGRV
jgi:exo-beta-1,3-glucanase (GH17 family)